MRAIILAAGKGARLGGVAAGEPKCLARVGDLTLIGRQILALEASAVHDIIVVVGYGADRVQQTCGGDVRFITNTIFDQTNSLYSLWLARHLLRDGFLVMNADVLFHRQLLRDLLTARYEDALLVAFGDETTPALGDEEMKVKVRGGRVVDISKAMNPAEADGENVGIAKFGPAGAQLLIEKMDALIAGGSRRDWAPRAFLDFASERPLHAISTRGYPWIEIDFPEDYHRAIDDVLPQIIGEKLSGAPSLTAATDGEHLKY